MAADGILSRASAGSPAAKAGASGCSFFNGAAGPPLAIMFAVMVFAYGLSAETQRIRVKSGPLSRGDDETAADRGPGAEAPRP